MKQPAINLMPEYILARSQAGVVAGRYLAALLLPVIVLIGPATHARLMLKEAEGRHVRAQRMAREALESEATANRIGASLEKNLEYINRYELVAMPLETSRLIATITNDLPASASLDRLDMAVSWPRHRGAGREAGASSPERPPMRCCPRAGWPFRRARVSGSWYAYDLSSRRCPRVSGYFSVRDTPSHHRA